jgi:5-hydroxyisourate hydrolase
MRITAQVLDSTYGKSAAGVRARLERAGDNGWITVADTVTNSNGRLEDWDSWRLEHGIYRIVLDSDSYFAGLGASTAYPEVAVIFRMRNEFDICQLHVTLSPYSYSAYCGATNSQSLNFVEARLGTLPPPAHPGEEETR